MKKTTFISLLLVMFFSSSVHALSWAIQFVVWEGNVYEVKQEEVIKSSQIGQEIGEVKTKPDEMTGNYYGNASNFYPIGTKYYEIKELSTSTAIAIEEENQWVKAVYVHKAPFHMMNMLTNPVFILSTVIIALLFISVLFRIKESRT